MKTQLSSALLQQLEARTRAIMLEVRQLEQLDPALLMEQPTAGKWSVAQVIEHLVSYGRYYLPLIKNQIKKSNSKPVLHFRPGWLGHYFTKSMSPKNGVVTNPMRSPKPHAASASPDSFRVMEEFISQEFKLLELLHQASNKNLQSIRIPISLTPLIRLKLGDVFSFLVAHHERHFVQINNVIEVVRRQRQIA